MPLYLTRPDYLHRAANVLSSTSEDGLTVAEPSADTGNDGTLRLRCSGSPTIAAALDIRLQSGGAPTGYAAEVSGLPSGAGALWRRDGDSASKWRGHVDTPALVRVAHPVTYDSTHGVPSSVKVLGDGSLGFIVASVSGTEVVKFYRISSSWVATSATIVSGAGGLGIRHDFAVLDSGRLVAVVNLFNIYYSDDHGLTWTAMGTASNVYALYAASMDVTCMEAVGSELVLVAGSKSGAAAGWIAQSRDGGATWSTAVTTVSLKNPRTAVRSGVVHVCDTQAVSVKTYTVVPGGGLSTATDTGVACNITTLANSAIACRDDGVLWAFGWQAAAAGTLDMDAGVSTDGGVTWADSGGEPLTLTKTAYGTDGMKALSAVAWRGMVVMLTQTDSASGSDGGLNFLCFGEWSTYGERCSGIAVSGTYYRTGYLPVDYPQNVGWTRTATGAGGTVTNQPFLRAVTTAGNGERWTAPAAVWSPATGAHMLVKARTRVNSGGSLSAAQVYLEVGIDDATNQQKVKVRLATTGARVVDSTGAQLGSDLTATLTNWTDWIIDFWHDNPAGSGKLSIYYMQDGGDGYYIPWLENVTINEQAGVAAEALQWEVSEAASADLAMLVVDTLAAVTYRVNPDDLRGRPLSAVYDYQLHDGLSLGAYGTGGIPGDTYALSTRYTYGKDRTWSELRPSARTQSTADNAAWALVFYAGGADKFKGDLFAAFGTNMRAAKWQMNDTDSWGAPSVDQSLDATLASFTVGAGVRGLGYVGPTASPNWRPGQWKSNGDSRRYFLDIAGTVYEITDNDEDRLYVDSTDLSAAAGTAYIFGDRMAATFTFGQYKYGRFAVTSAQQTADNVYRLGTPIVGKKWSPDQLYDWGFVDRIEPNVTTVDVDNGSSMSYRRGPQIDTLSIQWPPLDRLVTDVELRLRDFYRSIDGSLTPVVLWRASTDLSTLSLVQVREVYSASNVLGELSNAVTRVDQLILREVW